MIRLQGKDHLTHAYICYVVKKKKEQTVLNFAFVEYIDIAFFLSVIFAPLVNIRCVASATLP